MSTLSKEVVEFGQTGLKELKDGVKDMKSEMTNVYNATEKLKRSMASGSYSRAVTQYEKATKALAAFRKEQDQVAKNFQRDRLRQSYVNSYGRAGGTLAYAASQYGGGAIRGIRSGIAQAASSGLGIAASFGAPLAVGALANRGFQGTAAAARLDMEFTRLSRVVAQELLPAMSAVTNAIAGVTRASYRVKAGTADRSDYATNLGRKAVLYGGSLLALRGIGNFAFPGTTGAIASAAGRATTGLARAGVSAVGAVSSLGAIEGLAGTAARFSGRAAGPVGLAYALAEGGRAREYDRGEAIKNRGTGTGDADTPSDKVWVESVNKMSPGKRDKFIRDHMKELYAKDRVLSERAQNRGWLTTKLASLGIGAGQGDVEEQTNINRRLNVAEKLQKGTLKGQGTGLQIVAGAGERRDSSGLNQELAEAVAQRIGDDKQESGDSPNVIMQAIRDAVNDLVGVMSPGSARR